MDSLMNKIKDIMERYNLCFWSWWRKEKLKTIDLFYILFFFSAFLFCVVSFFLPAENVMFTFPLHCIVTVVPLIFAEAIFVSIVLFPEDFKESF